MASVKISVFVKIILIQTDNELLATTESFGTLTGMAASFTCPCLEGFNQAVFGSFFTRIKKWEFIS